MLVEDCCCEQQVLVGLTKPIPPSLAGRLSRSRIESFGGLWPVMAGLVGNESDLPAAEGRSQYWGLFGRGR